MPYKIRYKSSVSKELRKLADSDRRSIVRKITNLNKAPRPEGSAKLKGSDNLYRIRHGDYRIIYQLLNSELIIIVIRIGHRRDVYKKL